MMTPTIPCPLAGLGRRMEATALVALGLSHGGDAMTATPAGMPAAPDRLTLAAILGVVVLGGVNAIAVKLDRHSPRQGRYCCE